MKLDFLGTKQFHEGTRFWDVMGGLWEALKHREAFDVYLCPKCGHLEFFLDGIGDELRGEAKKPSVLDDVKRAVKNSFGYSTVEQPRADSKTRREAEPWQCAGCQGLVPANFEICWRCQTPRPGREE